MRRVISGEHRRVAAVLGFLVMYVTGLWVAV